jgi:hypothetical protein
MPVCFQQRYALGCSTGDNANHLTPKIFLGYLPNLSLLKDAF